MSRTTVAPTLLAATVLFATWFTAGVASAQPEPPRTEEVSTAPTPQFQKMAPNTVVPSVSLRVKPEQRACFLQYAQATYGVDGIWQVDYRLYGRTASWQVQDSTGETRPLNQPARDFEARSPRARISAGRAPDLPEMNYEAIARAVSLRLKREHLPSFAEYAEATYEGSGIWRVDFRLYGQTASWYVSDETGDVYPLNQPARDLEAPAPAAGVPLASAPAPPGLSYGTVEGIMGLLLKPKLRSCFAEYARPTNDQALGVWRVNFMLYNQTALWYISDETAEVQPLNQPARDFQEPAPPPNVSAAPLQVPLRMDYQTVLSTVAMRLKPEHLPSFIEYAQPIYYGNGLWQVDYRLYGQTASWSVWDQTGEVQSLNDPAREFEQPDLDTLDDASG